MELADDAPAAAAMEVLAARHAERRSSANHQPMGDVVLCCRSADIAGRRPVWDRLGPLPEPARWGRRWMHICWGGASRPRKFVLNSPAACAGVGGGAVGRSGRLEPSRGCLPLPPPKGRGQEARTSRPNLVSAPCSGTGPNLKTSIFVDRWL